MSVLEILDDIKEGISDQEVEPNDSISQEHVKDIHTFTTAINFNVKRLDTTVEEKFNQLYKRCVLKKTLSKLTKVDKSTAMEAMAALPAYNKVHEAKLTSAPSAINKKILDEVIFSENDQIPPDLFSFINETLSIFNTEKMDKVKQITDNIEVELQSIREQVANKYKTALVIYDNTSYNLLSDDLFVLSYEVKDTELDYPPYGNALNDKAKVVLKHLNEVRALANTITQSERKEENSVMGFISLIDLLLILLKSYQETIKRFVAAGTYFITSNSTELTRASAEAVETVQLAIEAGESLNNILSVFTEDNEIMNSLTSYVSFID